MVAKPMVAIPNPIDIYVGSRVRQRRTMLGMNQEALARRLDLSFQQIQKYERGTNRIGSSRLFQLSQILDVPIGYFFEGVPKDGTRRADGSEPKAVPEIANPQSKRETLELVRAFTKIPDPVVRKRLLEVAKAISKFSPPA